MWGGIRLIDMIPVTELRIGNYVSIYGSISQVVPSDFDPEHHNHWVTVKDNKYVIESWEPIHITEEWLRELGAEDFPGTKLLTLKGYLIQYAECRDVWVHTFTSIELKSVHQTQNLFHALTGEELKMKES